MNRTRGAHSAPARQPAPNAATTVPESRSQSGGASPHSRGGVGGRGRGAPRGGCGLRLREKPRVITENIGSLVEVISIGTADDFPIANVQNVASVASYDWLDRPTPTMAVPGM